METRSKKICECGKRAWKDSHLCFGCREDALEGVKSNITPRMNRGDKGAPVSNDVLRSCGVGNERGELL